MKIQILSCLEGAEKAQGLTVIIDVFRAFSVECFLTERNVRTIHPMGSVEECLSLKKVHPEYYLVGERKGIKLEGFDVGNSPSQIVSGPDLSGKTVIHSTSAGTQGIVNATGAEEILTGSLVNAAAIARYIKSRKPEVVSLVPMGLEGLKDTQEDLLCARYIKALLEGKDYHLHKEIAAIRKGDGAKFFDKAKQEAFPEADFFMCLVPDIFDFVLKVDTSSTPFKTIRIDV